MIKNLISTIVLGMAALAAHAEGTISSPNVLLRAGDVENVVIAFATEADNYRGFQFDVVLPTGINVAGIYDVGRCVTTGATDEVSINKKVGSAVAIEGTTTQRQTVLFAADHNFSVGEGALARMVLSADASVTAGTYVGQLTNVVLSYAGGTTEGAAPCEFTIEVYEGNARVVLDENSTEAPEASDGVVDVRVKRTIAANQWSTICLPFAMTEAQVAEAFGNDVQLGDFGGYETAEDDDENIVGITVKFNTLAENAIEANHPYIIKVSAPVTEFSVSSVEIDPEEEPTVAAVRRTKKQWSEMIGTYVAGTELEALTLFLSGNKFYYSAGLTKMKAYRAYFDFYDALTDVEEAYSGVKMSFNIDGVTTDIDEIENSQSSNSGCFDLSGRRVAKPTQRGVYVVGGHKVAVR